MVSGPASRIFSSALGDASGRVILELRGFATTTSFGIMSFLFEIIVKVFHTSIVLQKQYHNNDYQFKEKIIWRKLLV
jgi:hypothetical protein